MAEPHWTGYVGMATGIIGTISGVAGAIMGYVSYRRSNSLKSLDLRLQLRKEEHTAKSALANLAKLIDHANSSRKMVAAGTGRLGSSMMQQWKKEVEDDKTTLGKMLQNAPNTEEDYEILEEKELETRLVRVHEFQGEIDKLKEKYEAAIRSDDKDRERIREAPSR